MYQGASEVRPRGIPVTLYPTIKLLAPIEYHGINHIVSEDNWFTQLQTAEWLVQRGIHFNGTIKTNRSGVPRDRIFPYKRVNVRERGDVKCMEATHFGYKFYFTAWMDSKPVHMLSTYMGHVSQVIRNTKDALGAFVPILLSRPTVIKDYNEGMGGTDQGDQLASYYRYEHRTTKWPHRIFSHFMMTAAVNAHILYKEHHKLPNLSLLEFLDGLMDELILPDDMAQAAPAMHMNSEEEEHEDEPKYKRMSTCSADITRICSTHTPILVKGERRKCRCGCSKRTNSKCLECDVHLCINYEGEPSCWTKYHTTATLT